MAFKSSRLLIALACLIFASHCAAQLLDTNKGVQYAVQQDDNESYWTVYGTSSSLNADSEPWAPGPSQTWILDSSGSPSGVIQVQIINSANSVCLQMPGCGSGFSSNIGACDSSHGPFQMWQIDTNNDGTYVIWSVGCGIARSLGVYPDFQRITLLELHNPNDVHIATTSIVGTTTVSIVKDVATSTMIAWVILTSTITSTVSVPGTTSLNQRLRLERDIKTTIVPYASVRTILETIIATDIVTTTIASSTSTVTAISTTTTYTTMFVVRNPAQSQGAAATGLSTGAKAGIGIGVAAVAVLLLVGLSLYFWRARRKRDQRPSPQAQELENEPKSELGTSSSGWNPQVFPDSGRPRAELQ